jgi:hypothetical protein
MKQMIPLACCLLLLAFAGCSTVALAEYYTPQGSTEESYKIGGDFDPFEGGSSVATITINDEVVIAHKIPGFGKTTEAVGEYNGKRVDALFTKVRNFSSSYIRAEVSIDGEKAVKLIF